MLGNRSILTEKKQNLAARNTSFKEIRSSASLLSFTMSNEYKVTIISSLDEWKKLSVIWNSLLKKSASNTIFLTWEWLFAWAECFLHENRRLFIIGVYRNDELVGIAPWYISYTSHKLFSMKQIKFLGSPEAGSDYLDVIAIRGKELEVAEHLYQVLFHRERSSWDCLNFSDILSHSLFLLHFLNKIDEEGKYAEIKQSSFCPFISLPQTGESFLASRSAHRREQFRQAWKILKNDNQGIYRSLSSGNGKSAIDEFFSLYEDKSGYDGQLLHQLIKKFSVHSKEEDRVQIDFLTVNGVNIAGILHLRYQDGLYLYLMVVDKTFNKRSSMGNLLVGLSIENALKDKMTRYDFLKGTEQYKFYWADSGQRSLSIFIIQKKLKPFLFMTGRFIKYMAKTVLR